MSVTDLKDVHAVELELLKAVAALCDRHGLRYYLYCGTLLGAVRHKGFIPWDDDVDLAMPLADYRKFQKVAGELPAPFVCTHYGNTREYYLPWTKVSAEGTTGLDRHRAVLDIPWGLSLDIYPMIGAAESETGLKIQRGLLRAARRLRAVPYYRACGDRGLVKRILIHTPFPVLKAVSDLLLRLMMRDPDRSRRVGTIDAAPFEGKYDPADWKEVVRLPFEDSAFTAPAAYDRLLRRMYGDYMQLPPEDQRGAHESKLILDPHRDYREYRRELLAGGNRK